MQVLDTVRHLVPNPYPKFRTDTDPKFRIDTDRFRTYADP